MLFQMTGMDRVRIIETGPESDCEAQRRMAYAGGTWNITARTYVLRYRDPGDRERLGGDRRMWRPVSQVSPILDVASRIGVICKYALTSNSDLGVRSWKFGYPQHGTMSLVAE